MQKIITLIYLLGISLYISAQAPDGYYDAIAGLSGDNARLALHDIIDDHTEIDYDNIWGYFNNTDIVSGVVLDIYSSTTYSFNIDQCGAYTAEGDCYNREHSVPQVWFNSSAPMYSDLFHIYPSDGFVNGQRGSLAYGEVGSASYTSTNGCATGSNNYPGFSGTVFEPADEYKGDLARTYFYMATRYMDVMSGWSGDNLQGNSLAQWTINMMINWHENDPVSQKEIDRNNSIYNIQGNRNPYIDSPNWVDRVFLWPTSITEIREPEFKFWYSNNSIYFSNNIVKDSELSIYDSLGKLVKSVVVYAETTSHQLNLTSGIYFAVCQNSLVKLVVL